MNVLILGYKNIRDSDVAPRFKKACLLSYRRYGLVPEAILNWADIVVIEYVESGRSVNLIRKRFAPNYSEVLFLHSVKKAFRNGLSIVIRNGQIAII